MTRSAGSTKKPSHQEHYRQNLKVEGGENERGSLETNCTTLPGHWSKGSPLQVLELQQNRVAENGRSRSCSSLAGEEALTSKQGLCVEDFLTNRNKRAFLSDDENCDAPGADSFQLDGEKESKQNQDSTTNIEDMSAKSTQAKPLTEQEKIRERSRKGRERSLRTRRRNIARLRLLEENCIHFSKENEILRELARSLGDQDMERVMELFKQYSSLREEKPEPHKLSQSESYYTDHLSPLSVTASTAAGETDSKVRKETEAIMSTVHSLIPSTYRGLHNKQNSAAPKRIHETQDVERCVTPTSVPAVSDVSVAQGNNLSSTDVFHSVFADPAYCDDFGFTAEDIYEQPPLSAEEICLLLEEGGSLVEVLRL